MFTHGEVDVVDGAEDLLNLSDLGLVFKKDGSIEVRDHIVRELAHGLSLACMGECSGDDDGLGWALVVASPPSPTKSPSSSPPSESSSTSKAASSASISAPASTSPSSIETTSASHGCSHDVIRLLDELQIDVALLRAFARENLMAARDE